MPREGTIESAADSIELTILDAYSPDHAVAVGRSGSDVATAKIPFGKQLAALLLFRDRIEAAVRAYNSRPTEAELTAYGRQLFEFAMRDDLARLYGRLPATNVSLHLLSTRSELQNLPWEYLQEPGQLPGPRRERCVVRITPTIGRAPKAPKHLSEKIRMLFVAADPIDQEGVSWEDLRARIEKVFEAQLPDRLELEVISSADRKTLLDILQKNAFDIFHFSGHGDVDNKGRGRLILMDRKSGKSDWLGGEDLGVLLNGRDVRLAILSACSTSQGDFKDNFAVMAQALIGAGVPAVVANQLPLPDQSVATFVAALYNELLRSGDIDRAVTEGRIALKVLLGPSKDAILEWGIPTLYRLFGGAQLYDS